jgi:hypothetical protein
MKLLVPYIGELQAVDGRLARLADFLGIACEAIPLPKGAGDPAGFLERAAFEPRSCLVIHPRVLEAWLNGSPLPPELISLLLSRFPFLLVHAPRSEPFDTDLIAALSSGHLRSVQEVGHRSAPYEISPNSEDVCGAFTGLTFGKPNTIDDHVFSLGSGSPAARDLISVAGLPLMSVVRREQTEIFFLAGQDIAELNVGIGDSPLAEYFSRLLPHAMALRYIFGEESWRPRGQHASVIVDDPLLRSEYGFLSFRSLLDLMERHHFHTCLAFIPHNFRRSSAAVARMFLERPERFSLCFHGNDHTAAEFASTDAALLSTMLQVAERRMDIHRTRTGLECERVMVFPQGKFSTRAMAVLKAHNFDAAVNTTPYPLEQPVNLGLAELTQPAVLRYASFPLFLRESSARIDRCDVAFKLFFGRPVFIVEHHDVFKQPEVLVTAVSNINAAAPQIRWSSPGSAIRNSHLWRRTADGTYAIRAYSRSVRLSNTSGSPVSYRIEWHGGGDTAVPPKHLLRDGAPCPGLEESAGVAEVLVDLPAGASCTFDLAHQNNCAMYKGLGFKRAVRGFVRRRLSELRDNHLSKHPLILAGATTLQKRLTH